jgi:spore coat protein U-like protein
VVSLAALLLASAIGLASVAAPALAANPPSVTSVNPKSGGEFGGTVVVLFGSGFMGATAVDFGATAATKFTVNNGSQITVTSPRSNTTGPVDITVTTPSGTSAVRTADQFTYVAPTVTNVSPAFGPVAGGTTVTITGTGFSGQPIVSFGSNRATSTTVDSSTQITATTPAADKAGSVFVSVATLQGINSPTSGSVFTYVAPPTVTDVSPKAGPTTGGTTVTITGTGFAGGDVVAFGATRATSVTVNSSTSITATTPAEPAGLVDVSVVGLFGVSQPNGDSLFLFEAVPTTLKAAPALVQLSGLRLNLFNLSATLTNKFTHAPIEGAAIAFSAGKTAICTATTDATGTAKCNGSTSALSIVLGLGYKATYLGDSTYLGSTATGALIG